MESKALSDQQFSTRIIANIKQLRSWGAQRKQRKQLETLLLINNIGKKIPFDKRDHIRINNQRPITWV